MNIADTVDFTVNLEKWTPMGDDLKGMIWDLPRIPVRKISYA